MLDYQKFIAFKNTVYYIHYYYPKRLGEEEQSKRIRLLKIHDIDSMNYYFDKLVEIIPKGSIVCCVPPSHKGEISGLMTILEGLNKRGIIRYRSCLDRIENRDKKAYGGKRNIEHDLKTIIYKDGFINTDDEVLLIDDVCTTSASLAACKSILESHGVYNIKCVVLGLTKGEI